MSYMTYNFPVQQAGGGFVGAHLRNCNCSGRAGGGSMPMYSQPSGMVQQGMMGSQMPMPMHHHMPNPNMPNPHMPMPMPMPMHPQMQMQMQPQMQTGTMPPQATSGDYIMPGGTVVPGPSFEQSYVENILRLNLGKVGTFYMTYENNSQWNAKIFKGVIEAAGRDHIIISDPVTGQRILLLMINLDYVTFDEPLVYQYPGVTGNPPTRISEQS